jgi:hypothetical protein
VHRRVSVYDQLGDWPQHWPGLRRWLCVERWGYRDGKPFAQTHYFTAARRVGIDSIAAAKRYFANRIDKVLLSLQ